MALRPDLLHRGSTPGSCQELDDDAVQLATFVKTGTGGRAKVRVPLRYEPALVGQLVRSQPALVDLPADRRGSVGPSTAEVRLGGTR